MKSIQIKFGKRIKDLRKTHDFTQDNLAAKAKISTKYLQNLESKNPKKASIVTIESLAKAFDISISELMNF